MKNDCILELDFKTALHLANYLKSIYHSRDIKHEQFCMYCDKLLIQLTQYFKAHKREEIYESMRIKIEDAKAYRDSHVKKELIKDGELQRRGPIGVT